MPGTEIQADLERDVGVIDLRRWQCTDPQQCGTLNPPAAYEPSQAFYRYGVVGYLHGVTIDEPLLIERRYLSVNDPDVFRVMPIPDYRGSIVDGADLNGARLGYVYDDPYLGEQAIQWPGWREYSGSEIRDLKLRKDGPTFWMGSLAQSKRDPSGLTFQRNRYYDPVSGLFTQEDPIGIAGGLNLYGYANGDPINFSDPFGLTSYVGCRPVGGKNDGDESSTAGHCAVRVVNEELGIDLTVELDQDHRPGRNRKVIYTSKTGEARTEAYGNQFVPIGVPEGMSVNDFDKAVVRSALEVAGQVEGQKYAFTGGTNSNRFVFQIVTGAGGQVPWSASARFKFAPGICGGSGLRKGTKCGGGQP